MTNQIKTETKSSLQHSLHSGVSFQVSCDGLDGTFFPRVVKWNIQGAFQRRDKGQTTHQWCLGHSAFLTCGYTWKTCLVMTSMRCQLHLSQHGNIPLHMHDSWVWLAYINSLCVKFQKLAGCLAWGRFSLVQFRMSISPNKSHPPKKWFKPSSDIFKPSDLMRLNQLNMCVRWMLNTLKTCCMDSTTHVGLVHSPNFDITSILQHTIHAIREINSQRVSNWRCA